MTTTPPQTSPTTPAPAAPLPRSTPEAQGLPSAALLALLDAAEQRAPEWHGLIVLRHGHVVAEGTWAPHQAAQPHMLYSLSKSFCSTAAGLAAAEGKLSLDDKVLTFFPDEAPADPDPNLAAMRVRDLLAMASGHDGDTTGRLRGADGDWARGFLSLPVEHAPGTHFVYNSGATYMVSALVQRVTGRTILDYLRPRLLDPLGIGEATWENSPQGVNVGGWGLRVTTDAIARLGQLYLQRGVWQGQRLLSEEWVREATSKQVSNGDDPDSDWQQGYGFQFWRCRHNAFRGDGAFGQFCVVLPEHDAVIAITGGIGDLQGVLNVLWDHLLPAFHADALPPDPEAQARLSTRLAGLTLNGPQGEAQSPTQERISSVTFTGPAREDAPTEARWDFTGDHCALTLRDAAGQHRLEAAADSWLPGRTRLPLPGGLPSASGAGEHPIAARGTWTDPDTYAVRVYFLGTPYALTLTAHFSGNAVRLERRWNLSFGGTELPAADLTAGGAA